VWWMDENVQDGLPDGWHGWLWRWTGDSFLRPAAVRRRDCRKAQRREQRGGALALVIMGHRGRAALLQGARRIVAPVGPRKPTNGWVRSSAWIWDFPSTQSTTARSGGSR